MAMTETLSIEAASSLRDDSEPAVSVSPVRQRRRGIGFKIYLGLFGSVALVSIASFVAYYFLGEIVAYQSRLAESSIPNLNRVVEIARESTALVNGATRMTSAISLAEHQTVSEEIMGRSANLLDVVGELTGDSAIDEEVEAVQSQLRRVASLLGEVYASSARRLEIQRLLDLQSTELTGTTRRIEDYTVAAIDDQGFFLVEGMRNLGDVAEPRAERDWSGELAFYRALIEISRQTTSAGLYLGQALLLTDKDLVVALQERFLSTTYSLNRLVQRLEIQMPIEALSGEIALLVDIGGAEDGIFALRTEQIERLAQENAALAAGREAANALLTEVERLVAQVNADAVAVNTLSQSAASRGIWMLVSITLASILGAVLIGWLFVGRSMVSRLVALATSMGEIARGNLQAPVAVSGNDEVTDMADTLEVFRQNALEVQRLNPVEEMALEIEAKNKDLEHALERLHKAQQQIVAEEKLSSLGQLAAGVAHEIKNPLNFIKNFNEVSLELIEEVEEVLGESRVDDKALIEDIQEILRDLRTNLGKVGEHSLRADGIVRSMLEHSRGKTDEWRAADLNALLKQYRDLAYHSMRAENTEFNVTIREELDETIEPLVVVPQDLSRAFLNILTNACQAIEEKTRGAGKDYQPLLVIGSRRVDDGFAFWVRDNGTGIPDDIKQHMFEPFVTTKGTGKGTGLGLSLTVDILTRHNGTIEVESEVGEFTCITIKLPLQPAVKDEDQTATD